VVDPKCLACLARDNRRVQPSLLRDEHGNELTTKGTLDKLISEHCPGSKPGLPTRPEEVDKPAKKLRKRHLFISKGTVKKAIKEFKNGKAPGPDGITPNIMKHLPGNILNRLVFIMKSTIDLAGKSVVTDTE
jgi:hypothetical protein